MTNMPLHTPAAQRILLVEDQPEVLAVLQDALEEAGHPVLVAREVQTALALAHAERPHLIVIDADRPRLAGSDLLQGLQADRLTAAIPVILLLASGSATAEMPPGVVDQLIKPIRPSELLAALAARRGERAGGRPVLDAFGHASVVVHEKDGRCSWQSPLARELMATFFQGGHFERGRLPPEVMLWMHREVLRRRAGGEPSGMTVMPPPQDPRSLRRGSRRLSFTLQAADADAYGEGQWLVVMRESDEALSPAV